MDPSWKMVGFSRRNMDHQWADRTDQSRFFTTGWCQDGADLCGENLSDSNEKYPWSRDFVSVQYIQRSWIFHYRTSVYDFCMYWTEKYIQLEFFLDWVSLSSHIYRMAVVTWRLGTATRAADFRTVMINWFVVWNMNGLWLSIYWEWKIISTDELHHFSEGWNNQPVNHWFLTDLYCRQWICWNCLLKFGLQPLVLLHRRETSWYHLISPHTLAHLFIILASVTYEVWAPFL